MRYVGKDAVIKYSGGGVYSKNLLNACPPLKIEGNFWGGAAIAEELLQRLQGYLEFLPSLPDKWTEGEVKGLVAREGFMADLKWKAKILVSVYILVRYGFECKIKSAIGIKTVHTRSGKK